MCVANVNAASPEFANPDPVSWAVQETVMLSACHVPSATPHATIGGWVSGVPMTITVPEISPPATIPRVRLPDRPTKPSKELATQQIRNVPGGTQLLNKVLQGTEAGTI